MNKQETKNVKNAINAAVLERTKDEILSELAYLKRLAEKLSAKSQERVNGQIGDIIKEVTQLIADIEVGLSLEEVE